MTGCCPRCGQPLPTSAPDPVELKAAEIEAACRDRGFAITFDGFVSEVDAAALLAQAPGTLRNWRGQDAPLEYRRTRGRIRYSIRALARFVLESDR